MEKIKVILIDDERAARKELAHALAACPDFVVAGEADNADEALKLIRSIQPDLLFLDIQMPEKSGFDLLEMLDKVPHVIFVTAFEQYALKAFENNALDYLLKPIREERFQQAIAKFRQRFKETAARSPLADRRIFIKDGEKCYFVNLTDIYLIESMDNYARLYFAGNMALIKSSLNQLENRLDQQVFFRINRTQLINTTFIQSICPMPKGHLRISLKTGELLDMSERQSVKFKYRNSF